MADKVTDAEKVRYARKALQLVQMLRDDDKDGVAALLLSDRQGDLVGLVILLAQTVQQSPEASRMLRRIHAQLALRGEVAQ